LEAAEFSLGYGYRSGEADFGLPINSEFNTQSVRFSMDWTSELWQQDAYLSVELPHMEITGPAALLTIIPLRDFVRLDRDRRIRFLRLLDIYSLQDIRDFSVSGTGDVTVAAGTYFTDPWFDDYSLALSFEVKWDNGDSQRGLGTGDKDYTLRLDYQYLLEQWTPELTLGFVSAGDIGLQSGEAFWFIQTGLSYQLSSAISFSASYYQGFLTAENIRQWDYSVSTRLLDQFSIRLLYQQGESATALDNNWAINFDYRF
jgi:hypothetical protein